MVYSLAYRRPPHIELSRSSSVNSSGKARSINGSMSSGFSGKSYGIPDALSFDRIISGGTCPPCTARDFMNYLTYIEHAAENLQFFLWYRDYCKRFEESPASERALSPEWTPVQAEAAVDATQKSHASRGANITTSEIFEGTDFASGPKGNATVDQPQSDPFSTPPRTPRGDDPNPPLSHDWQSSLNDDVSTLKSSNKNFAHISADAFKGADLKWQPFTVQPYREEISRIISAYLTESSPRELNISAKERTAVLHALENTTHPSALRAIAVTVEWSLRHQAHPNFIRWTICNGNRPRVIFARGLGLSLISLGFLAAVIITLSHASRGWRALAAILWVLGVATLITAWKGMCVVLHGMHHRHLRPWELFAEDDDASAIDLECKKSSFDTIGSSNSYEDQPWVAKYEKRNILRKIVDREVWIQEPALRQIQDTIFLQSIAASIVLSAILAGIFVALPKGAFF